MRIVHIVATAVGAPWLVELAREQVRRGHEVALIIPSLDGTIAAALAGSGVRCVAASVDILGGTGLFDRAVRLAKLVRLLRRLRPDVVHGHILNSVATARRAAWLADVPVRIGANAGSFTLEWRGVRRRVPAARRAGRDARWRRPPRRDRCSA